MPISKRPSVSTDSECASQAVLQAGRSGEAYTHVPTRRSARVAATASVGPGAGCQYGTSGMSSVEKPLSAMRRTRSRHVGRSVVSGATTPNRNGLLPPVAVLSAMVRVLSCRPGPSAGFRTSYERGPLDSTRPAEKVPSLVSIRAVAFVEVVMRFSARPRPSTDRLAVHPKETVTMPRYLLSVCFDEPYDDVDLDA